MKKIIIFLFIFSNFVNITLGQVEFDKNDGYFQALKIHLDYLNLIQYNDEKIFIKKEKYINEYSGELNGFNLVMISDKEIFRKTRNKKIIKVLKINELTFRDGNLETSIIIYEVSRKKNNYELVEKVKSKIRINYDCLENQFQYKIIAN